MLQPTRLTRTLAESRRTQAEAKLAFRRKRFVEKLNAKRRTKMEQAEAKQPDVLTQTKESVKVIEGFFQACNAASFPLQWHNAAVKGMQFMNQIHSTLMASLTPEQVEQFKAEVNKPVSPTEVVN